MVAKKRKSKRQTLQQKYKIAKRVKQHHKRITKGKLVGKSKPKKDENRIPNEWPRKAELLEEIHNAKLKLEEAKIRQKEKRAETIMAKRLAKSAADNDKMDVDDGADNNYENEADNHDGSFEMKDVGLGQNSRRAYLRDLRKVIESADVILHVLDARDPVGTRSTAIEEMVMSRHGKKLVYVLNKADLVPRQNLAAWLIYLRQSNPTIPFKCNLQNQKHNLGHTSGKISKLDENALMTQQAVGTEELLGILKNYCRHQGSDYKASITVGIVGFPNVGKSSLVNSLTRQRAVQVSSTAGYTKTLQEVILDKNIKLIDSPGIVFADENTVATSLRNCVNVDAMTDLITPVRAILEKCPSHYLMQLYSIGRFEDGNAEGFLALVARATGKLKKGGIPNIEAAAKVVLNDWNSGKIKYYTAPPQVVKKTNSRLESESMIVSSFGNQLDIDNLQESDMKVLDELDAVDDTSFVAINPIAETITTIVDEDDIDQIKKKTNKKKQSSNEGNHHNDDDEEEGSALNLRKLQQKDKKKLNKDKRRGQVNGNEINQSTEQYSFDTDFHY